MRGYYTGKLSGERLRRCYDIASPRVKQYLAAEIRFLLSRVNHDDIVLELGCGYRRVAFELGDVVDLDSRHEGHRLVFDQYLK